MLRINCIDIDDYDEYHRIALNKRKSKECNPLCPDRDTKKCNTCDKNYKAVMLRIENYIYERYRLFDNSDKLESIIQEKKLSRNEASILKNTFSSTLFEGTRKRLIDNLPNSLKNTCPFCMIGEPNTLEHYLPKEYFPEYALFSKNLVPCCSKCNTLKNTKYLNEDGSRRILYFYADDVNSICFLKAKVDLDVESDIPIIEYYISVDDSNILSSTIRGHFDQLRLLDRYNERAIAVLSSLVDSIRDNITNGIIDNAVDAVIDLLEIQAKSLTNRFGRNYWQVTLILGLMNNREVITKIIEKVYSV